MDVQLAYLDTNGSDCREFGFLHVFSKLNLLLVGGFFSRGKYQFAWLKFFVVVSQDSVFQNLS